VEKITCKEVKTFTKTGMNMGEHRLFRKKKNEGCLTQVLRGGE